MELVLVLVLLVLLVPCLVAVVVGARAAAPLIGGAFAMVFVFEVLSRTGAMKAIRPLFFWLDMPGEVFWPICVVLLVVLGSFIYWLSRYKTGAQIAFEAKNATARRDEPL